MDGAEPQKNHENKFSLVSVMAAMLRDSVVVRTRPRAIPLAMITTTEWIHGFPFISSEAYGASRSSAKTKLLNLLI